MIEVCQTQHKEMQTGLPLDCPETIDLPWTHPYRGSRKHRFCRNRLLRNQRRIHLHRQPRRMLTAVPHGGWYQNEFVVAAQTETNEPTLGAVPHGGWYQNEFVVAAQTPKRTRKRRTRLFMTW